MPKVPVYNQSGEAVESLELSEAVFGVKPKPAVIHQVYVAELNNARQPWAHTKTRGEVRGGGKKPWRQKGTGRARHGSIRSPIWRGGGVVFGPRNVRVYTKKVNQKTKQLALRMLLSDKAANKLLLVMADLPSSGKTKSVSTIRRALPGAGKSTLFLTAATDQTLIRSAGNLRRVNVERAMDASVTDLLQHQYVIINKDGIMVLEKRLGNKG